MVLRNRTWARSARSAPEPAIMRISSGLLTREERIEMQERGTMPARFKEYYTDGPEMPTSLRFRTLAEVVSGASILSAITTIITWLAFLLIVASLLLKNFPTFLAIGIGIGAGFVLSEYNDEVFFFIENAFFFFTSTWNYLVGVFNPLWEDFKPFVPAWNLYFWWQNRWTIIFQQVIDRETFFMLLFLAARLIQEIVPAFVQLLVALVSVLQQLIQPLLDIVQTLFANFIDVFVLLIEALAKFVVALIPVFTSLVQIFAFFVQIVVRDLGEILVFLIDILLFIIEVSVPFIQLLITDLATVISQVASDLSNNGGMPPSQGGFGAFFDIFFLFLIRGLPLLVKFLVTAFQMVVRLVTDNFERIVAFVVAIIEAITAIIRPIIVLILQLLGPSFSILLDLAIVLANAFIDLVPTIYDTIQELVLSGILNDLIAAIVEGFTAPGSPVLFISFLEAAFDVFIQRIDFAIGAILSIINVIIGFIPSLVDLIVIIIQSGILVTFLEALLDAIQKLLPIFVNVFIVLLQDVLIKVLVKVVLEYAIDLFNAVIQSVIALIVPLTTLLVQLAITLINITVQFLPALLNILILFISSSVSVITSLFQAAVELVVRLFADENLFQILFMFWFSLWALFLNAVFGIDITDLQVIFDLFFQAVEPFFDAVLGLVGESVSKLDPNLFSASAIAAIASTLFGGLQSFLNQITALVGSVSVLFTSFSFVLDLFKLLRPVILFVLEPAYLIYINVIKPAICVFDLPCCSFFVDFAACILGLGDCCCNDGPFGCPLEGVGCSCFFP